MPSPNDLSANPVQVLVNNGINNLDVSAAFRAFTLSAGEFTPEGLWRPTAQLTLAANTEIAESFDPKANGARWQPSNTVAISIDFGAGWVPIPVRLKIDKWPARPRRRQQTITLDLATDLSRLSFRSPEGDAGGAIYGSSTNRHTLINAVLTAAGCPTIATDTLTAYPLSYAPEKKTGGSWIDFAGDLAWSANHLLWQQPDGEIRLAELSPNTLETLACFAHYTVGSTEARYEPQPPTETPPDTFTATGTGLTLTAANDDPESFTSIVDGVQVDTDITYANQGTSQPEKTVEVKKPRNAIAPDKTTSTLTDTDTKTTTADTYDLGDGTLTERVITIQEPRAKVLTNSTSFALINAKRTTINYYYDSDKTLEERRTVIETANDNGHLTTYKTVRERWYKRLGQDSWNYISDETTAATDDTKAPKLSKPPTNQAPPATEYRPPAVTKEQTNYTTQITVASPTGGDYSGKTQVLSLPGGLCRSTAQLLEVVKLWASIRHGRQWPIAWAAPLTAAWLQSFSPIRRIDFTEDGTRTAYLVDALQIALTPRSHRVGGTTIELGTVALDGSGTPAPPFTIT